jgi:predicted NUDIX family NTP pyrophosphohydrolase
LPPRPVKDKPVSAGVLAYRWRDGVLEFLLVHPGGPYWRGKDLAAWSLPKGLVEPEEDTAQAAAREFEEELGLPITAPLTALTPQKQPGGKVVHAWLAQADLDLAGFKSNLFEMEWPPRSGRVRSFPEVDQAAYFPVETALAKVHLGQQPILLEAQARIGQQAAARP